VEEVRRDASEALDGGDGGKHLRGHASPEVDIVHLELSSTRGGNKKEKEEKGEGKANDKPRESVGISEGRLGSTYAAFRVIRVNVGTKGDGEREEKEKEKWKGKRKRYLVTKNWCFGRFSFRTEPIRSKLSTPSTVSYWR